MKKTLLLALAAIATIFTSCSSDIINDNDDSNNGQGKGMTLIANVEQDDTRATLTTSDDISGKWSFAYTGNEKVSVGNNLIDKYYTFTNNGANFSCADAKATNTDANWFAYYPGTDIDLTNQDGTETSAANLYALAGATEKATTGADGLTINMKAQAAVLRIVKVDNYGPCDIYLMTKEGKYVKGLKAKKNAAGFEVETSETRTSVFYKESSKDYKENKGNSGIYYVIVPAGVYLEVWNDGIKFKTTTKGLTAGKYYTLTTGPTTGKETATLANGKTETVDWVQLWIGGPRFAVKNVAEEMTWTDATKTGSNFAWGEKWCTPSKADLELLGKIQADHEVWYNKTEIKSANYPTFTLKTDPNKEYNMIQITGYQPGYNKNSIFLYNKISAGNNNYTFWTSTASPFKGKGYEFQIIENNGVFGSFGFDPMKWKDTKILVRPILNTKTILWSDQKVNK